MTVQVRSLILNAVCGYMCGPFDACWYAEPYFDQIYDHARGRVIPVYLKGPRDVKSQVWQVHEKYHRRGLGELLFIAGVGHGAPTIYTGYFLDHIYWTDMTRSGFGSDWARGMVFYLLSCLTARQLGPWMVKHLGAWSYLGWVMEFGLYIEIGRRKTRIGNRHSLDWYFLKPVEDGFARGVACEASPGQVYKIIYDEMTRNIPILRRIYPPAADALRLDRDSMRLIGRREMPPVPMKFSWWKWLALGLAAGAVVGTALALHR